MRVRLLTTRLNCGPGAVFAIGDEVGLDHVDELALVRLVASGAAELVEPVAHVAPRSFSFDDVLFAYQHSSQDALQALTAAVAWAEVEGADAAIRLHRLLEQQLVDRADIGRRLDGLFARAAAAAHQSEGAPDPAGVGDAQKETEAMSSAPDEPPAGQTGGSHDHSGVDQPVDRRAHNSEVGGANPPPAPKRSNGRSKS